MATKVTTAVSEVNSPYRYALQKRKSVIVAECDRCGKISDGPLTHCPCGAVVIPSSWAADRYARDQERFLRARDQEK
jgi:hypothetical protein